MTEKQFNLGLIFNQLPFLISKGVNSFTSLSDLLVKLARMRRGDPSITHDHSIFRKVRNSEVNDQLIGELNKYFRFNKGLLNTAPIESKNLKNAGAWFIVESMVTGCRASGRRNNDSVNTYLDFVLAHCELEKSFMSQALIPRGNKELNIYLEKWLLTKIGFPEPTLDERVSYICNLTMYQSALIEIGLEVLLETDINSLLSKVLPRYEIRNQDHLLIPSSEILLERAKADWAKSKYGKDELSWSQFHRDILIAQANDEDLKNKHQKYAEIDTINPDTDTIKKRFQRWRTGKLFTLEDFRTDLAILRTPYKESTTKIGLECYFLINIFTFVQLDLVKNGVHPSRISNLFSNYKDYKNLVHKRFCEFKVLGRLTP